VSRVGFLATLSRFNINHRLKPPTLTLECKISIGLCFFFFFLKINFGSIHIILQIKIFLILF
jgi:hypothetical protein